MAFGDDEDNHNSDDANDPNRDPSEGNNAGGEQRPDQHTSQDPPPASPPPTNDGRSVTADDEAWLKDTYNKLFGRDPEAGERADLQRMHDLHGSDASSYRDYYASQVLGPRTNNQGGSGQQGSAINFGNYNSRTGQGSPNGSNAMSMSPFHPDAIPKLKEWDALYVQHLGRHLGVGDVNAIWQGGVDSMPSSEAIKASILASPEYKSVMARGGPSAPSPNGGQSLGGAAAGPSVFGDNGAVNPQAENWWSSALNQQFQPFTEDFVAPTQPQGLNNVWNTSFQRPRIVTGPDGVQRVMSGNYLNPQAFAGSATFGGQPMVGSSPDGSNRGPGSAGMPDAPYQDPVTGEWKTPSGTGNTGAAGPQGTQEIRPSSTATQPVPENWGQMSTQERQDWNMNYGGYNTGVAGPGGSYIPPPDQMGAPSRGQMPAGDPMPGQMGGSSGFAIGEPSPNGPSPSGGQQRMGTDGQGQTLEQADPGYDFRMGEAMKALQRSAAAKGTLLTGGTSKAIQRDIQDYASNEYDKIYGRDLGEYGLAYNIFNGEKGRQSVNYADQYNRSMQEYLNKYNISRSNQLDSYNMNRNNVLDSHGMATTDRQLSDMETMNAFDIWNTLDSNYYNRMFQLSNSGMSGAAGLSGLGSQIADYMTQLGNARAAGTVGSANAWNQGLSNVGNSAVSAYYASQAANQRRGS